MSQTEVLILNRCFRLGACAVAFVFYGISTSAKAQDIALSTRTDFVKVESVDSLEAGVEVTEPKQDLSLIHI